MYLFFDTETSDLPKNYKANESDIHNWPRVIQIAWMLCDSVENASTPQVHLIKPEGFTIAKGAFEVHRISTEHAQKHGVAFRPVLDAFIEAVNSAKVVIAHNIEFDTNIIGAECVRAGLANPIRRKKQRCTMKESVDHCRLPGKYGFKWPSLEELHNVLFNEKLEHAHDAASDCATCMKCFFRLKELRVIS